MKYPENRAMKNAFNWRGPSTAAPKETKSPQRQKDDALRVNDESTLGAMTPQRKVRK